MSYLFLRPVWQDKEYKDRIWTNTNVTAALRRGVLNPGTILQMRGKKEYWMVSGRRNEQQELLPVHTRYVREKKPRGQVKYSMCPHCKNKGAYTPVDLDSMKCKFSGLEW